MIVPWEAVALIAVIGACVGSFINVVCYRLPIIRGYGEYKDGKQLDELKATFGKYTLLAPSSSCTCCKTSVPFRYNVPVFGWMFARGKCSSCGTSINKQYPLVELLFACAFGLNAWADGLYPASLMTLPAMTLLYVFAWFKWKYSVRLFGVLAAFVGCIVIQGVLTHYGLSAYSITQQ